MQMAWQRNSSRQLTIRPPIDFVIPQVSRIGSNYRKWDSLRLDIESTPGSHIQLNRSITINMQEMIFCFHHVSAKLTAFQRWNRHIAEGNRSCGTSRRRRNTVLISSNGGAKRALSLNGAAGRVSTWQSRRSHRRPAASQHFIGWESLKQALPRHNRHIPAF